LNNFTKVTISLLFLGNAAASRGHGSNIEALKKEAEKKAKAQGITYISKTPLYDTDDLFHRINTFLKVL